MIPSAPTVSWARSAWNDNIEDMKHLTTILFVFLSVVELSAKTKTISYNPEAGEYGIGTLSLPDVPYGKEEAVLSIHGGGGAAMDRAAFAGVAEYFTDCLGMAAFNIEYTLAGPSGSGKEPWPACGNDCVKAAEWMFSKAFARKAGFSPKRIWICGGSAGGHLALWTGLNLPSEKVAGIISISGIADPLPDYEVHTNRYNVLFGGHAPTAEELESMSIMNLVRSDGPRILLTHESEDTVVPIESARHFLSAYRDAGNEIVFYEYSRSIYDGLTGHCIWIPGSKPHRLIPQLESEIEKFVKRCK